MRTAISVNDGTVSSMTLLRRLGDHSRKNRLYRAFRELGWNKAEGIKELFEEKVKCGVLRAGGPVSRADRDLNRP